MKTVKIICECNPFHGGHEYLISRARASGADAVVAVMSGSFVQRGEPAVADMHLRAKAVLSGGADLVLELPFPYSASPAEFFAAAGVEILASLGVEELWFGSECDDITLLGRLAALSESPDFQEAYAKSVNERTGTAEAYVDCLARFSGESVSLASNDLLGIAYLRAICKKRLPLRAVTVKRKGSAFTETTLSVDNFPSATALRRLWQKEGVDAILPYLPQSAKPIYRNCVLPPSFAHAERLILGWFRLASLNDLESVAELAGGLGARLKKAATEAKTLEEMLALAATKKYTSARILRGILFALTGITEQDLRTRPAYTRLLAANGTGCGFLKQCQKNAALTVVTRRTDLPDTPEATRQAILEERAQDLYALCCESAQATESLWKKTAYIEKKSSDPLAIKSDL